MFFQWNQCKTIGDGDQDFWNRGPKYEIVENTTTWFIFFLKIHLVKGWKSGMIENEQVMESGGIEKILMFPHIVWLIGGVEKWSDGKLFSLVE